MDICINSFSTENNKKIALAKAAALLGKNKTKIASMTGIYIP